jgi:hypothetical protein
MTIPETQGFIIQYRFISIAVPLWLESGDTYRGPASAIVTLKAVLFTLPLYWLRHRHDFSKVNPADSKSCRVSLMVAYNRIRTMNMLYTSSKHATCYLAPLQASLFYEAQVTQLQLLPYRRTGKYFRSSSNARHEGLAMYRRLRTGGMTKW